jgi:diguanylate cyclase (GGDEF)-like protein/PAS domain S-box-containing protein
MHSGMDRVASRRVVAYGCAVAVSALWTWALRQGSPTFAVWLSDWGLAAVAIAAAGSCALTARRTSGRVRSVWTLLAASAASWGSGMLVWAWYECVLRESPFPSLADAGYLAAMPLAALALLRLPLGPLTFASQVRAVLDGLMIGASSLLTSWVLVLGPLVRAGGDTITDQMLSLAYPLGDAVIVTIVLYVLLRGRADSAAAPVPIAMIGVSLAALAVADSGFAYLQLTDSYTSGSLNDVGWFVGYALLFVTARQQSRTGGEQDEPVHRPLGMLLPYGAVSVSVIVSSIEVLRTGGTDPVVSWIRSLLLVAMVARQVLTLRENAELTRTLEQRVADRTAELLASQQRFEALVQHSSDVVTILDEHAQVLYQSESATRVFGFTSESIGRGFLEHVEPADRDGFRQALAEAAEAPLQALARDLRILDAGGRTCFVEMTITNLLGEPSVQGLVLNTRDVSERKQLERQLVHEASHDSLTGLANRALFERQVRRGLLRASGLAAGEVAVLFLDLDGFKEVNDSLGHAYGDLLLVAVAERLRRCVRQDDTVARLGGDEFAVLVSGVGGGVQARQLAERLTAELREPFLVQEKEIHVRGSVGIAVAEQDTIDAGPVLRNADLAMYRAKAAGEGGYTVFDPGMHSHLVQRLSLETDLRRAIRDGAIEVHYQPTVALSSGAVVGMEALARWNHLERGSVPPSQFIPIAEDSGLIHELGRWVLDQACRQTADWRRAYPALDLTVSVNLSGRQLARAGLVNQIRDVLDSSGLSPHALVLEMTESVLMEHTDENLGRLRQLRALGVRLAIDDFGTGYSSLSYLQQFPVNILKIDRSFVERMGGPGGEDGLVQTILSLSNTLRLATVAEGVEDHRQMLALRRLGCDFAQGFHISRPVPAVDLTALLHEQASAGALTAAS